MKRGLQKEVVYDHFTPIHVIEEDNPQLEELYLDFAVKNEILTANDFESLEEHVNHQRSPLNSASPTKKPKVETLIEEKEDIIKEEQDREEDREEEDNDEEEEEDSTLSQDQSNKGERTTEVWWANQASEIDFMDFKSKRGHLRSYLPNETKKVLAHHERIQEMRVGDVVIHYAKQKIRAISRVIEEVKIKQLPNLEGEGLVSKRVVEVGDLTELEPSPEYHSFKSSIQKLGIKDGPINKVQTNQGYLYRLSWVGLEAIQRLSSCTWPEWSLPIHRKLDSQTNVL